MSGLLLRTHRLVRGVVLLVRQPNGRALALLVVVQLVGGTGSYTLNEGWPWLDSLCSCVTTLATVGLGDLAPASAAGKLFTMAFVSTGVGLLATFSSMLAQQFRSAPEGDRR